MCVYIIQMEVLWISWANWANTKSARFESQICLEVPFLRRQMKRRGFPWLLCPRFHGKITIF